MKRESQRAATFIGIMFVGVAFVGVLANLRHGLNVLVVMIGVLRLVLCTWGLLSRPN